MFNINWFTNIVKNTGSSYFSIIILVMTNINFQSNLDFYYNQSILIQAVVSHIISNEIISYPLAESTLYKRVHFRSFQKFNFVVIQKQITKHANQTYENNEKRKEKIPLSGWYGKPLDFSSSQRTIEIFPYQASKWLRQSKE